MNGEPVDRPDPHLIATAADFAHALSALRTMAGLSVREVSARLNVCATDQVSSSTLGGWFSGRHLPAPALARSGTVAMLLAVCGETDPSRVKHWLIALDRVRRRPGSRKHLAHQLRPPTSAPSGSLRELPGSVLAVLAPEDNGTTRESVLSQLLANPARAADLLRPGPDGRRRVIVVERFESRPTAGHADALVVRLQADVYSVALAASA
jgi:hypothetical protein